VPSQGSPGSALIGPGQGSSQGTDTQLVPYESVYGQFRTQALSDVDRQVIPEQQRALVRAYFGDTTP
jgi:hypothetical protein